jgi:hypothetical protein
MTKAAPDAISGPPDLTIVKDFREATLANGYRLIRVRTREKAPVARGWQEGEAAELLLNVTDDATNTGLICNGFRVIDVDIDDAIIVCKIIQRVHDHLPAGALIRRRAGSPRCAIVYRAEGAPEKRVISGPAGKVEILGAGQQLVIDGIHSSGARLTWVGERSPATIGAQAVPVVSEAQIDQFLNACSILLGAGEVTTRGNLTLGPPAQAFAGCALDNELGAGIDRGHWFDSLTRPMKRGAIQACLDAINNRKHDPRDQWLSVLFAVGDAEVHGCPDARELALTWSRHGAGWTTESDFDTAWNSFKPGGITVATLIHKAQQAGADLTPWKNSVNGSPPPSSPSSEQLQQIFGVPQATPRPRSISAAALPAIPPKRKWLHGTDVARGAVSLLVAPGARGKSTWLLTLALACASGRSIFDDRVFGGPLRVLYINAEDSTNEIGLRLRAAMTHHGLTDADVAGLQVAGVDTLQLTLLAADRGQPRLNEIDWKALVAEIDEVRPDMLIIDPLVSLMGGVSLNDNSAAALAMGQFVRIAAQKNLGIVIAHHAAKNREATSAEAAMGAASLVNLARICLAIEPLAEGDAGKIGVAPWEARSLFRVVGTKQNLSPPGAGERWFKLISVDMPNAEPPIYPNGDRVAAVEVFKPNPSAAAFPAPMISAALSAIASANPPLSPFGRAAGTAAAPAIAAAIAPYRGGHATDAEAKALLDYLIRTGRAATQSVSVPRQGRGPYARNGLVVVGAATPPPPTNGAVSHVTP